MLATLQVQGASTHQKWLKQTRMYELESCDGSDSPCSPDKGEQNYDDAGRYCLSHSASDSDDETSGADALAVVPVAAADDAIAVH